ncbi:MAG: BamA/TamA family outer membrane protein, partial [Gemmatimonadaceae bacterium]
RRAQYLCVDTLEVQRDALRLAVLHRQQGWFLANVTPEYIRKPDGVKLLFRITPGPEARIDSVFVTGLPTPDNDPHTFDGPLLSLRTQRFDRLKVQAQIDTVVDRLHNSGYARAVQPVSAAVIDTASATDSTPAKVRLSFAFTPGIRLRVGEVHVRVQGIGDRRTVDSADIMSLIRLRAGQRYSGSNVIAAQRDLYRTDAFKLVLIDTIAPRIASGDTMIDFQVTVAEARTRYAKAGVGWATQDCGRIQARAQDRAFLAPGRRAEVSMRASKLGVGAPFDFAKRLCAPSLRDDPFSEKVNYYLGTTISNTRFFGAPFAPVFSIYSERRGEPFAYLRETSIGSLFELSSTLWRRTVVTPGIQYERGRTISDPLISCTRFGLCQPEDEAVSLFGRGVGVISTAFTHDRTNSITNPTYGSRYRTEVRAGVTSASTKRNFAFYRGNLEVSAYQPLFRGTIATRVQLARVFAPNAPLVNGSPLLPQQERLFAGGQNSVRGFQQNVLGPVVYAFNDPLQITLDTINGVETRKVIDGGKVKLVVPRGGTALVVGNIEWRRRVRWPTDKLQIALFADAGTVFEADVQAFDWRDVRVTPGFGVRLDTPLGPFRLDVGYNGYQPQAGRALFFTGNTTDTRGAISCVSPGNTIPVGSRSLDLSKCPSNYRPAVRDALSRFVFHFSLGQAF